MPDTIREVMTGEPVCLEATATAAEAAREMAQRNIGPVLVTENGGTLKGIVTDRDIVVRAIAEGRDPQQTQLGDICTAAPETLSPDQSIDEAVDLMRSRDVRRLPVVEDGTLVGIVSIGDLAVERQERSALADISAAPPNN